MDYNTEYVFLSWKILSHTAYFPSLFGQYAVSPPPPPSYKRSNKKEERKEDEGLFSSILFISFFLVLFYHVSGASHGKPVLY
jgi:hypothetical protein